MARPLRISYPNAFYHVTCRGNDRRAIFRDDHDRTRFLERLRSALEIFSVRVHAYVPALFLEKLKGMKNAVIKGSAKDQPSYRMIQSVEAEALLKQAADYFRLSQADLTRKRGHHRQERALVMELLHRYSGLKQRVIGERFGGLDEGLDFGDVVD